MLTLVNPCRFLLSTLVRMRSVFMETENVWLGSFHALPAVAGLARSYLFVCFAGDVYKIFMDGLSTVQLQLAAFNALTSRRATARLAFKRWTRSGRRYPWWRTIAYDAE